MKNEWQEYFLDTLEKRFKEMKAKNPRVSIRGFAKIAQLSPGAMSLMLNRSIEWSLSVDRAFEVLHLLKVDSDRINHFAVLASPLCIDSSTQLNSNDKHAFLSDPYYMPICLSFGLTPRPTIEQMAESLDISSEKVSSIVEDLITRGYLMKSETGETVRNKGQKLQTGDGPPDDVIRQHHLGNLDAIRHSLINDSLQDRDVTSLVFTGNSRQIDAVTKEIRQFYQRVHAIMNSSDERDEVFKIVVGFMPLKLSQLEKKQAPQPEPAHEVASH